MEITTDLINITSQNKKYDYKDNYKIYFINDDYESIVTVERKNVSYYTKNVLELWTGEDINFDKAKNTDFNFLYDDFGICKDIVYIMQDENTFEKLNAYIDGIPNFTGSKLNEYEIKILAYSDGAVIDPNNIDFTSVIDVTDNYNITYNYGTLEFDDEIKFNYSSFGTFNNLDYVTNNNFIFEDEKGKYIISNKSTGLIYENAEVKAYIKNIYKVINDGDMINTSEILYAGEYKLDLDIANAEVYIYVDGVKTYSKDHKVLWQDDAQYGTINIYKSTVHVRPLEKIYTYDGNSLDYEGFGIAEIFDGELGNNHYLWIDTQIDDTYTIGSTKRIGITDLAVYSMNETGEYVLFDKLDENYVFVYYNDSEIVNEDMIYIDSDTLEPIYTKTDFRAKFKCTERQLGIITESASKLYDGQPFMFTDYSLLTEDVLLDGHTFVLDYWYSSLYKAGTDNNDVDDEYWKVIDSLGNDVSKYYEINKKLSEYGDLEIIKRDITIRSGSASKPADGEALYCYDVWVDTLSQENLGLADGDYIDLEALEFEGIDAIYVGEYENIWSKLIIRNSNGTNVTKSYNITAIYGTLTITVPQEI